MVASGCLGASFRLNGLPARGAQRSFGERCFFTCPVLAMSRFAALFFAGGLLLSGCASTLTTPTAGQAPVPTEVLDVSLVGTWAYEITNTPQGDATGLLTLRRDGDGYAGDITSDLLQQEVSLTDLSFAEQQLTFKAVFDGGGQLIETRTTAQVLGDTMEGTMVAEGFGSFPFSANRSSP